MNCARSVALFLFLAAGCYLPPERLPLQPLPEEGQPIPYADLVTRARVQATAATEAFYVNGWTELEEAARGLAKTARFLDQAAEVPAKHKENLAAKAGDLGKEAVQLREAAKAKDVKQTNEILQRIHLKVRDLRPVGE